MIEYWIGAILECICSAHTSTSFDNNKNVTSLRLPKGVIVMDSKGKIEQHNIKLIVSAIFEGNTFILINDIELKSVYTNLCKLFPHGVFEICSDLDVIGKISGRLDISVFIGNEELNPALKHLPLQDTTNSTSTHNSWVNILKKVTFVKNVWN